MILASWLLFGAGPRSWGELGRSYLDLVLRKDQYSPNAITAFVYGPSQGVVVDIHAEVSVCVMSWVEVGDHSGGNSQTSQHCKSRAVWGHEVQWRQYLGAPHCCPSIQQRHTSSRIPVLRVPAKTQHWPYRTGLKPDLCHSLRISTLPFQFLGSRPPV